MPTSISALIVATLGLALVQIWLLPMLLNLKNTAYLLSSRDGAVATSVMYDRVDRAAKNLQESLPAFLALCLVALYSNAEILAAGSLWLGFRILYVPMYMSALPYLRSLVWIASIVCMIWMALQIV